jgi:phosphate-selective porin OprO and OprP
MKPRLPRLLAAAALVILTVLSSPAAAATDALFYREVERDGAIYVFTTPQGYQGWRDGGRLPGAVERPGWGPTGGTVIFEDEAGVPLFAARHGNPGPVDPDQSAVDAAREEQQRRGGVFVGWKDGRTRFQSKDALLELRNRVEVRFTQTMPDESVRLPGTGAEGAGKGSFRIRRAKTELTGWVWRPELTYELQLSWAGPEPGASTDTPLEDLVLNWDFSGKSTGTLTFGQFKVPLGRQEYTSSNRLQFCDRDILSGEFTRGRDVGVMLDGTVAKGKLDYAIGVFNGNPASRIENDNDKYQYNARLLFQPWGNVAYSEGDFESKDHPLLELGLQFENNDLSHATNANNFNTTVFAPDLVFKFRGFSIFGEYFWRERDPETGPSFNSNGYHVQAGYFLRRDKLEIAFRYASYDPSDAIANNDRTEIGGAVSYFIHAHNLKLQSDFRQLEDEGRGITNHELRIQTYLVF